MSAGRGVFVLFFRCYLWDDWLWGLGTAKRVATVRPARGIDRHSDVWALDGVFLRYSGQKNFTAHSGRKGANSDAVKHLFNGCSLLFRSPTLPLPAFGSVPL